MEDIATLGITLPYYMLDVLHINFEENMQTRLISKPDKPSLIYILKPDKPSLIASNAKLKITRIWDEAKPQK